MIKKQKPGLKEGAIIWVPCEIKQGMFPTERYITVNVGTGTVSGFIPREDVKEEEDRVRAVIARVQGNSGALLFRGEIFPTTNPVTVSTVWLAEKAEVAA